MDQLVSEFYVQPDLIAEAKCKVYRQAFDTTMAFVSAVANTWFGPLTEFGPKDKWNGGTLLSTLISQIVQVGVSTEMYLDMMKEAENTQTVGFAGLPSTIYSDGWCTTFEAGKKDQNFGKTAAIGSYLSHNSANITQQLLNFATFLMKGDIKDGNVTSYLSLMMNIDGAQWSGHLDEAESIK